MNLKNSLTLCIVGLGLLFGSVQAAPVYLMPENHKDESDKKLYRALMQMAVKEKMYLGVEHSEHDRTLFFETYFGDEFMSVSEQRQFLFMEEPFARMTYHFLNAYGHLARVNMFRSFLECAFAELNLKKTVRQHMVREWGLGLEALGKGLADLIGIGDTYWDFWQSIPKGEFLQEWSEFLSIKRSLLKSLNPSVRLAFSHHFSESIEKIKYSEVILESIGFEIKTLIGFFIENYLSNNILIKRGVSFEVKIDIINEILHEAWLAKGCSSDNLNEQLKTKRFLLQDLGVSLRDIFMVQSILDFQKNLENKELPIVAVVGNCHALGMYHFLKLNGIDVRVGMKKNTLGLKKNVFKIAKEKTLERSLEECQLHDARFFEMPIVDEWAILKQHQNDPQAAEALKVLEAYHQSMGYVGEEGVHDEL